jgi:hypothetical protein
MKLRNIEQIKHCELIFTKEKDQFWFEIFKISTRQKLKVFNYQSELFRSLNYPKFVIRKYL